MQSTATRSWATAGVALVGAAAIAATPVTAPAPDVQSRAVQLTTAGIDLFSGWENAFTTAMTNTTALWDGFTAAPLPVLQQVITNDIGYLKDLLTFSPASGNILGDILTHVTKAFEASTFLGGDQVDFINPLTAATLDSNHSILFLGLTGQAVSLGFADPGWLIHTLTQLMASPLSGVLIGAVGPLISPLVELGNSLAGAVGALFSATPDWTTALNDLLNIPGNMVGAFLNGSTLDLSGLIPLVKDLNLMPLPTGSSLDSLSFTFGGLLSAGDVAHATTGQVGQGVGGSILNSLGIHLSHVPIFSDMDYHGVGVGPLGALEGLGQIIAGELGWNGQGWPLADLFDAGHSAGAAALDAVGGTL